VRKVNRMDTTAVRLWNCPQIGLQFILLEVGSFLFHNSRNNVATVRSAIENLLLRYLGINPQERVIFIHDGAYRDVAAPLRQIASENSIRIDVCEVQYDGIQPLDNTVAELLVGPEYGVILFGTVHNIWHTSERRRAKYELRKRLAALVCPPEEMGGSASLADVSKIGAAAQQMKAFFEAGMTVRVTTPAGSDFSAIIGTPFCEHGNYSLPGTGGDFPSGEVGFGPQVGSVNGRIVYDVKVQHIGLMKEPLCLQVQEDRICVVSGPGSDRFHQICAERGDVLNYISEISIGLNPLARVSAAPAYIPEEKTFGTVHCGHGGNASYGTRVGPHIDGVMANPTVVIGGRVLMRDGALLPGLVDESTFDWLLQK